MRNVNRRWHRFPFWRNGFDVSVEIYDAKTGAKQDVSQQHFISYYCFTLLLSLQNYQKAMMLMITWFRILYATNEIVFWNKTNELHISWTNYSSIFLLEMITTIEIYHQTYLLLFRFFHFYVTLLFTALIIRFDEIYNQKALWNHASLEKQRFWYELKSLMRMFHLSAWICMTSSDLLKL